MLQQKSGAGNKTCAPYGQYPIIHFWEPCGSSQHPNSLAVCICRLFVLVIWHIICYLGQMHAAHVITYRYILTFYNQTWEGGSALILESELTILIITTVVYCWMRTGHHGRIFHALAHDLQWRRNRGLFTRTIYVIDLFVKSIIFLLKSMKVVDSQAYNNSLGGDNWRGSWETTWPVVKNACKKWITIKPY